MGKKVFSFCFAIDSHPQSNLYYWPFSFLILIVIELFKQGSVVNGFFSSILEQSGWSENYSLLGTCCQLGICCCGML